MQSGFRDTGLASRYHRKMSILFLAWLLDIFQRKINLYCRYSMVSWSLESIKKMERENKTKKYQKINIYNKYDFFTELYNIFIEPDTYLNTSHTTFKTITT